MRWIRLDVSWDDSPWLFDLPADAQLAWVKLLCYVKRDGSCGTCKAMAPEVAAKRWGVTVTSVTALLSVATADGALRAESGTWTVCNWSKYQDSDTTRAERQKRFRERSQVQIVTESNGVTTVTDGVTCRVTETETETYIEKELPNGSSKKSRGVFQRPSLDELRAYFSEIGLIEDPQRFMDYYQANGWKVGRNQMKDWKATARNWKSKRNGTTMPPRSRKQTPEDVLALVGLNGRGERIGEALERGA